MLYFGLLTMFLGASAISRYITSPRDTNRPSLGIAASLILTGMVLITGPHLPRLIDAALAPTGLFPSG